MTRNLIHLQPEAAILRTRNSGALLMVVGPLIAVAFGRWGSYLKVPGGPFYLPDIAVAIGLLLFILGGVNLSGKQRVQSPSPGSRGGSASNLVVVATVLSVGCIILGIANGTGSKILSIRDAMPFVYFAIVPFFVRAILFLGHARMLAYLSNAVIIHTIWIMPAKLGLLQPVAIPIIGGVPAFTTRNDFDMLICGLAIAVIASDNRIRVYLKILLIAANVTSIATSGSRAGMIAGAVAIGIVLIGMRPFKDKSRGPMRLSLTLSVFAIIIPLFFIYRDNPPVWAVGLQKLLPNDSAAYESGQNTWNARIYAWQRLIHYTTSDSERRLFGSGFGSNPIRDSGALDFLSGDPQVRAAHNFLITWHAFLGIVGVSIAAVIVLLLILASFYSGKAIRPFTDIGRACTLGVLLTALGGVILESPFGYMTFALSVAIAIARPTKNGEVAIQKAKEFSRDYSPASSSKESRQ